MRLTRRAGFKLFEAVVRDGSGTISAVWLNQPFMASVVTRGSAIILYGPVERRDGGPLQVTNPQYELPGRQDRDAIHTGRIVPIYEQAGCATCRVQRTLVHDGAPAAARTMPTTRCPRGCATRRGLPDWRAAVADAHFPPAGTPIER